jgi:hypothetical protein
MRKSVAPAIFILGFILLSAWNCYAGPGLSTIGGEYFIVGTRTCAYVNDYLDFGENFTLPYAGGTTRSGHYQGHLFLNADRTGSWQTRIVQYNHQSIGPGQIPYAFFDETCNVFYEQLPNRLRLSVSDCFATATAGAGINTTWEIEDISLTFSVSMNGDILLLSNTSPAVETVWQIDPPGFENNITKRVCSRTLTAIRRGR